MLRRFDNRMNRYKIMKRQKGQKMGELIYSEFRNPRQMLASQEYDGHLSIHDDQMAGDLGFSGAPIEGPTHFSQFVPLLHTISVSYTHLTLPTKRIV